MLRRFAKNHSLKVQLMDNPTHDVIDADYDPMQNVAVVEAYAEIAKDFITHAAFTIGGVFAACKIIERICK